MPRFDNLYAKLPERFYSRLPPQKVPRPGLIRVNLELGTSLGFDKTWLTSPPATLVFAGNRLLPEFDVIAAAYAGHQFGGFNPQLGDGRAVLLGEILDPQGRRFDMQLKGSGPTPYSRGGDGRSPLGPVLREYIVSEAMHALEVPTTRSLAAVSTGDQVYRDRGLPGAVLTRIASSHIRVGTFEYFAARRDTEALRILTEHVLARHYPSASRVSPALSLLKQVSAKQAELLAKWQLLGFIHGVMNTDNCLVSGETIDYGPCAFLDNYEPGKVFSSIDRNGRYAYENQPTIAAWNLMSLARALMSILSKEPEEAMEVAQDVLDRFAPSFQKHYQRGLKNKLGLASEQEGDELLCRDFLSLMAETDSDFTLSFRKLADLVAKDDSPSQLGSLFEFPPAFESWLTRWHKRGAQEGEAPQRQERMYSCNPAIIPRNHRVEEAIQRAQDENHFCDFHDLVDAVTSPSVLHEDNRKYASPPKPEEEVRQTFCGT